jgi:Amt family ammonium transporter
MEPHNVPYVLLGAGILWFGWFGFNAGSALAANNLSAHAFVNTNTAAAAAMLAWIAVEKLRNGKSTTIGAASGAVAGLVAITPACGFVNLLGATVIGIAAGAFCCLAVSIKFKLNADDSLDVLAVHFVGGLAGALLIGFFGTAAIGGKDGLFDGGNAALLGHQALAVVAVAVYSFAASALIALVIKRTIGLRVSDEDEEIGLDISQHAERAYDLEPG